MIGTLSRPAEAEGFLHHAAGLVVMLQLTHCLYLSAFYENLFRQRIFWLAFPHFLLSSGLLFNLLVAVSGANSGRQEPAGHPAYYFDRSFASIYFSLIYDPVFPGFYRSQHYWLVVAHQQIINRKGSINLIIDLNV